MSTRLHKSSSFIPHLKVVLLFSNCTWWIASIHFLIPIWGIYMRKYRDKNSHQFYIAVTSKLHFILPIKFYITHKLLSLAFLNIFYRWIFCVHIHIKYAPIFGRWQHMWAAILKLIIKCKFAENYFASVSSASNARCMV